MKLLSPQVNRDLKGQEMAREVLRTQEIKKASEQARKDLARSEADFSLTLAGQRLRWAQEEKEHEKRKAEMSAEINTLEAKKLNALIPIGIIKKGAEDRMQEAVNYLAELKKREEYNNDLTERLEDKLDTVGQIEQDNKKESRRLSLLKEGIDRQAQITRENSERLTKEMAQFALERSQAEKDIDERKTAIFLQQTSLEAKAKQLDRTEKTLDVLALQLKDERGTLDRAWQELERKKVIPLSK